MAGRAGSPGGGDAERRTRRWALLVETAQRFAASLDEEIAIKTVVEGASKVLAGVAILTLLQPDGGLRIAGLYHPDPEVVARTRTALAANPPRRGAGIMGQVALTGEPRLASSQDALTPQERIYFDASAVRTTLSAPLRSRSGLLGVLTVTHLQGMAGPPLDQQDLELARALAAQAALAIETARIYGVRERDRALYQAAIRSATAAIVIYNADYVVLDANDAFLRIFGRDRDAVTGHRITEIFPTLLTRHRSILTAFERVLTGRDFAGQEVPFDTPAGRTYWDVNHNAARDPDGRVLAGIAAIRDVTAQVEDRRRLQRLSRVLQRRATELNTILAVDPGAIALLSGPDLSYSFANQRYRSLLPAPDVEIEGRSFREFDPFGSEELSQEAIEDVSRTGVSRRYDDYALPAIDGTTQYFSVLLVPLPADVDEDHAVLIAAWETTAQAEARRRIESLAREMAGRSSELRAIFDAMEEGVFVAGADGRLTLVNAAGARIMGLTAEQALQPLASFLDTSNIRAADGSTMPVEGFPLARALRGESGIDAEQIVRRYDTGADVLLRVAFSPIRDPHSHAITGAVAVASDITEIRRLERQRDDFLSLASHELRTPLASVKGYAQMLLRMQARQALTEERLVHILRTVDRETDKLEGLVAGLLDISKIRSGRLHLRLRSLDLATLVREILDRFATTLPERYQVERELPPEPLWVAGDSQRLIQIVENLLDNAVKYAPEGGVLQVRAGADPASAYVSIRDEGIGFPQGGEEALFEPYARASNAPIRNFGGLGLGLYISRALAEQHKGTLTASSGKPKGAMFTLRLPLLQEPLATVEQGCDPEQRR